MNRKAEHDIRRKTKILDTQNSAVMLAIHAGTLVCHVIPFTVGSVNSRAADLKHSSTPNPAHRIQKSMSREKLKKKYYIFAVSLAWVSSELAGTWNVTTASRSRQMASMVF